MSMKVKFFGIIRERVGRKEIDLEFDDNKIKDFKIMDLIEYLDEKYGLKEMLIENEKLRPYVNILVNGENIRLKEGLNTEIKSGDQIALFPAAAGGLKL